MSYQRETPFQITADNSMVYSLRGTGRFRKVNDKMEEIMENEVTIMINARHLPPEDQEDIARAINAVMNLRYQPKEVT